MAEVFTLFYFANNKLKKEIDMNKLFDQLVQLLKIKSIVTIIAMIVFAVLSLNKTIGVEHVMTVITMIITFYFTKKEDNSETK